MPRLSLALSGAAFVLATIVALGGCAVGPDFAKPDAPVSEQWSGKGDPRVVTQTAVNSRWWQAFNDPALDRLIQAAYRQNLPLQIAALRIMESRARLGLAIGGQFPQQQEAFGSATKIGLSRYAPNSYSVDRNHWDYQLGFDAIWELDFWGKFRRDVEASRASLIASMADYDDALVSLTAEVARTYTLIRTYQALIDLASENVRIQEEGLRITESRFHNGVTTELDVAQARTLLESTRAAIPQLETQLRQSQNALATLLGQPTGIVQTFLAGPQGIPTVPVEVAVSVPAELLRRRPDIRSAELAAAAQCARIGVAKADLFPSFSLFGELGYQASSQGGVASGKANLGDLFDSSSFFYSFGPQVKWPILNYGRLKNNVRIQDARFQELLVNYRNTVLKAAQEVEDSLTGFLKAQETAALEQNAVTSALRSVEIALKQYKEGAVDYQRVLDTQRALLQEQNSLAQARSSIATNLIALYKALGGGWELRQGQPILAESTLAEMEKRTDWGSLLPPAPLPETLPPPAPRKLPAFSSRGL
ncbi:MAG: efflux transporter outer membrane subunit [Deltaproteobacteria bacterium]|nr:efflux transporter outer membrane subunit [Deltaproteobacteria bacterium]